MIWRIHPRATTILIYGGSEKNTIYCPACLSIMCPCVAKWRKILLTNIKDRAARWWWFLFSGRIYCRHMNECEAATIYLQTHMHRRRRRRGGFNLVAKKKKKRVLLKQQQRRIWIFMDVSSWNSRWKSRIPSLSLLLCTPDFVKFIITRQSIEWQHLHT